MSLAPSKFPSSIRFILTISSFLCTTNSKKCEQGSATGTPRSGGSQERKRRIEYVVSSSENVRDYSYEKNGTSCTLVLVYPTTAKRLLFVSIIESKAKTAIMRAVAGISRCAFTSAKPKTPPDTVSIEGINLHEIWAHDKLLDLNRLRTNDTWAVRRMKTKKKKKKKKKRTGKEDDDVEADKKTRGTKRMKRFAKSFFLVLGCPAVPVDIRH